MDKLLEFLKQPYVLTALQILFGFAVKKLPGLATWPNRLIPVFNALLAILINLAGHTDNAVVTSLVQTAISTGLYEGVRNPAQWLLQKVK